jgi:hypothetical protein
VSGSLVRPVAGAVHEDLVAGVDEPVQEGLGDDGVGEQRVPVGRGSVGGQRLVVRRVGLSARHLALVRAAHCFNTR